MYRGVLIWVLLCVCGSYIEVDSTVWFCYIEVSSFGFHSVVMLCRGVLIWIPQCGSVMRRCPHLDSTVWFCYEEVSSLEFHCVVLFPHLVLYNYGSEVSSLFHFIQRVYLGCLHFRGLDRLQTSNSIMTYHPVAYEIGY